MLLKYTSHCHSRSLLAPAVLLLATRPRTLRSSNFSSSNPGIRYPALQPSSAQIAGNIATQGGKRAREDGEEVIVIQDDDDGKGKAPAAAPGPALKAPFGARAVAKAPKHAVDALGWTIVPPSLIYRDYQTEPSAKIAAFDLDGTLIATKSGASFARGPDDWRFLTPNVPAVLKGLQEQGYKIVIFSNQNGVKSALTGKAAATAKGKANQFIKQAGVSALVMFSTGKDDLRKPGTGMWDRFCRDLNGGLMPDKAQSFFVGDAAGRPTDWVNSATGKPSDTDLQFARNVGLEFKVPEDLFG